MTLCWLNQKGILAVLIASSVLLAACGDKSTTQATANASAPISSNATERVYKIGSEASFAPFESIDNQGKVIGFDVDVMNAIAEKGGFKVEFKNTPWEGIFASLEQGDIDMVVSAVTITDERKVTMDFSDPYFEARQQIAVLDTNTSIKTVADLLNKKVAVQTGSTGDTVAKKAMGNTSPSIKRFESLVAAMQELSAGGVDAVIGDNAVIAFYIKNNPGQKLRMIEDKSTEAEFYGFALKKGASPDLLFKINAGLKDIQADGTYAKIE
ncbi:MAG: basic amino acid ABC transporter substrate-binding protein, partial [Neisseriaceae bacterium]|nr:basic amino acid ABC transporter substrate-binding protein [Neisseriaceae bacterium]